jgi:hypothetical protein
VKRATLVKSIWIGLVICGLTFTLSFALAAQETFQKQQGQTSKIDLMKFDKQVR